MSSESKAMTREKAQEKLNEYDAAKTAVVEAYQEASTAGDLTNEKKVDYLTRIAEAEKKIQEFKRNNGL